jgi:hypothetical protein
MNVVPPFAATETASKTKRKRESESDPPSNNTFESKWDAFRVRQSDEARAFMLQMMSDFPHHPYWSTLVQVALPALSVGIPTPSVPVSAPVSAPVSVPVSVPVSEEVAPVPVKSHKARKETVAPEFSKPKAASAVPKAAPAVPKAASAVPKAKRVPMTVEERQAARKERDRKNRELKRLEKKAAEVHVPVEPIHESDSGTVSSIEGMPELGSASAPASNPSLLYGLTLQEHEDQLHVPVYIKMIEEDGTRYLLDIHSNAVYDCDRDEKNKNAPVGDWDPEHKRIVFFEDDENEVVPPPPEDESEDDGLSFSDDEW